MFMKHVLIAILAIMALSACARGGVISKSVDTAAVYQLVEIDGAPFAARATIAFSDDARVEGDAPCNRYFATQIVSAPWFALDGIGVSRMACPDLAQEAAFFRALAGMTSVEVVGATLTLRDPAGRSMLFRAP